MELKRILWATDFSENAAEALPYVTSISQKYDSEVHVLYVLEAWGRYGAWYGDDERDEIEKIQQWAKDKAEQRLGEMCEKHLQGCPLYFRHIAVGEPAEEILKLAREENMDLIILATRGQKGRFSFGTVADRILKNSPVPVFAIPIIL